MEEQAQHQHIIGLVCSNKSVYSSKEYIIQPFSQSSFLIRKRGKVVKHPDGTESREPDSNQFTIIPTRVVNEIRMEDCQHAKANAEP